MEDHHSRRPQGEKVVSCTGEVGALTGGEGRTREGLGGLGGRDNCSGRVVSAADSVASRGEAPFSLMGGVAGEKQEEEP